MNEQLEKNILAWLGDTNGYTAYKAKNPLYDDNVNFEMRQAIRRLIKDKLIIPENKKKRRLSPRNRPIVCTAEDGDKEAPKK